MSKIDDIVLFVRVVKARGLAAAGRQIGLSPASMTARMNALEQRYNTRLLQRTTRNISLTDAGKRFYDACLRVLDEIEHAESLLQSDKVSLSGQLRITAPSDFGRQYVAPAMVEFMQLHPEVTPYLHLTDAVENLIEQGYDLGIRFGNLPDSTLIAKNLVDNHRVLVASPTYLKQKGTPTFPDELEQHHCLVLERLGEPLNDWQFYNESRQKKIIKVPAALASNDGAVIRHWALAGMGIAFKSVWDVKNDIAAGHLQTILDDFVLGFQPGDGEKTGLQLVYPNRRYVPAQVMRFIGFFQSYLTK
ncbi:MAG: LysR family transcriptional regulator [Candidatus Thiodiazotropha sp. (ex Codakia rugifera)]|nr:LysR family transcriptional regulator [Candidatus Thiodiazotropha sp. (ex Codakia rugifera)]